MEITNSNYEIAVQKLKERFGKPNFIIDAHYTALYKIPTSSNDTKDCRRVLDTIEKHLRILESMGEDINHNQLRTTMIEKFPQEIIYDLRMAMEVEGYSVKTIRQSLEKIISARETSYSMTQNRLDRQNPVENDYHHFTTEALVSMNKFKRGRFSQKQSNHNRHQTHYSAKSSTSRDSDGPPSKKRKLECVYCKGTHFNDACHKFSSVTERKNELKKQKRCFQCLKKFHFSDQCNNKRKCFHCGLFGKHNRSLCSGKIENSTKNDVSSSMMSYSTHETILPTALASVFSEDSEATVSARILFDTGSQRTYLTTSLAKRLKLKTQENTDLTVFTFGSMTPKYIKSSLVTISLTLKNKSSVEISAYVVPRITGDISAHYELKSKFLFNYPDIASDVKSDCPVDILIGSDYYHLLVLGKTKNVANNLFLVQSKLGWILSGQSVDPVSMENLSFLTFVQGEHCNSCSHFATPDPPLYDDNIKDIWELETIGVRDSPKTMENEEVIEFFNSSTKFENGRYQVKWPWIEYPTDLPLNLGLAVGRLTNLLKRCDQTILEQYDQILMDQLSKGVIERVESSPLPNSHPVHYLPHHCVLKVDKTTKLRIVYDASAKVKGKLSLNEYLYKGPCMLEDLVSLLLRFRTKSIGVTADIEKAFLQVGLQPEDRDVTRFVWVKDVTKKADEQNLIHFRFCRVPFGVISSPFLLAATIKFHLSQKKHSGIEEVMGNSLYVDNLIMSVDSVEEAKDMYAAARSSFSELAMNIREWNSNAQLFLSPIPPDQKNRQLETSVLGLKWDTQQDTLAITPKFSLLTKRITTKREALRAIASVYDPCGFVTPLTLPAKLMFQKLWKEKCKWDDPLSPENLNTWEECAQILQAIDSFVISRHFQQPTLHTSTSSYNHDLHCFTDASQDAYAAVVYLRTWSGMNSSVSFVMSRCRLTPL